MKYIFSIAAIFVALATAEDSSWEMPSNPHSWERTSVENKPDRVWVESDPSIPAGCSCFSTSDIMWAYKKSLFLTVDVDRETSCKMDRPEVIIDWASLDRSQWPAYDKDQTPVPYQRLYAVHDTSKDNYQCGRDGEPKKIGASEALACKEILADVCTNRVENGVCPCYSLADLVRTEDRIDTGNFIAHENTCSNKTGSFNGIYQKGGGMMNCETCSVFWYTHNNAGSCGHEGDIMRRTNNAQQGHCRMLMANTCKKLEAPSIPSPEPEPEPEPKPLCSDSATFTFNRNSRKTCKWAGRGNSKNRCARNDPETSMRVFEHCPKTCGKCACRDDPMFFARNNKIRNCAWAGARYTRGRCRNVEGMADNCLQTCSGRSFSKKCCKDNKYFKYKNRPEGCGWVNNYGRKDADSIMEQNRMCEIRSIVTNCPDTCKKCPNTMYIMGDFNA